jgi:hypothetical protein
MLEFHGERSVWDAERTGGAFVSYEPAKPEPRSPAAKADRRDALARIIPARSHASRRSSQSLSSSIPRSAATKIGPAVPHSRHTKGEFRRMTRAPHSLHSQNIENLTRWESSDAFPPCPGARRPAPQSSRLASGPARKSLALVSTPGVGREFPFTPCPRLDAPFASDAIFPGRLASV